MFKAQHTIITPVVGYNFKTALTVHNFHSQGSIPCRTAYRGVLANTYTTYPSHPTGYPFIHLGGQQQCGLSVLLKDKSARHWRESNPQPFDPESRVHSNIPRHLHRLHYIHSTFTFTHASQKERWQISHKVKSNLRREVECLHPSCFWQRSLLIKRLSQQIGPSSPRVILSDWFFSTRSAKVSRHKH